MVRRDKFMLLGGLRQQVSANKIDLEIQQLRSLARQLMNANNPVVTALWEIDIEMAQPGKKSNEAELLANKAKLERQLAEEKYAQRIDDVLEQIKALEISCLGHSELESNSPYCL